MKINSNAALARFISRNWIAVLLFLLLLWFLPRMLALFRDVIREVRLFVETASNAPNNFLRGIETGLASQGAKVVFPILTFGGGMFLPAPFRQVLQAWSFLDFFKRDDQIVRVKPGEPGADVNQDGIPDNVLNEPQGFRRL